MHKYMRDAVKTGFKTSIEKTRIQRFYPKNHFVEIDLKVYHGANVFPPLKAESKTTFILIHSLLIL
jgi:hypothetical protein